MRLLFFGLLLIIFYSSADAIDGECKNQVKNTGCCNSRESSKLVNIYCGIMMWNSQRYMEKPCKKRMRAYFSVYKQSKEVVEEFAKTCKETMGFEKWDQCINILLHFQDYPYCWTMENLSDALELFDTDKLLANKNYEKITMSRKEYVDYKKAGLELDRCADDLAVSFQETKRLYDFVKYLRGFIKVSKKNSNVCNCILVLGIKKLFNSLPENKKLSSRSENSMISELKKVEGDGDEKESTLRKMYYDICFNEQVFKTKRYDWTKERIDVLILSSSYLDVYKATVLLTFGTALVVEGWYTVDKRETRWPVNYLLHTITNEEREITNDNIKFIAKLIGFGFSARNYSDYISLLPNTKELGRHCARKLMERVLNVVKKFDESEYFEKSMYKDQFQIHLELLIKMYVESGGKCNFRLTLFSSADKLKIIGNEDQRKLIESNFSALLKIYKKVLS